MNEERYGGRRIKKADGCGVHLPSPCFWYFEVPWFRIFFFFLNYWFLFIRETWGSVSKPIDNERYLINIEVPSFFSMFYSFWVQHCWVRQVQLELNARLGFKTLWGHFSNMRFSTCLSLGSPFLGRFQVYTEYTFDYKTLWGPFIFPMCDASSRGYFFGFT